MSELPNGWVSATIPDLIGGEGVFVDGDWVESKDQDQTGDVRLIQLADVGDGRYVDKSNRFLTHAKAMELGCTFLKRGDVLIARMPDPLGRACIFPGDKKQAVTVVDVCVVRGSHKYFDHSWLMYFVNSSAFRADIHSLQSGSTRKRISRSNLSTLKLPVPPRAEQTRIVSKLEELLSDLDAGVAELKAAQKKLAQYRQSLLKAAVEGALTAQWREEQRVKNTPLETGAQLLQRILTERRARWEAKQLVKFEEQGKTPPKDWQNKYPEPVQPDTTELPELPEGWVWASLDALIEEGPQNGLYLPASHYGRGTPILRIDDYQIGWHRPRSALNLVDADAKTAELYALNVRDLVINRVNSMTHLGKSLCIGEVMAGVLFESNMMRLQLTEQVSVDFVTFYLGSDLGRDRLTSDAKWAVNQASINQQDVKKTPIPIPSPQEQQQVAELLSSQHEAMERQSTAIAVALKQSIAQRQNILRTAFAGELVPQDPNDEPASVLLERIRAERTNREGTKKPRGRKAKEAA